jgi:hypothetical protein
MESGCNDAPMCNEKLRDTPGRRGQEISLLKLIFILQFSRYSISKNDIENS